MYQDLLQFLVTVVLIELICNSSVTRATFCCSYSAVSTYSSSLCIQQYLIQNSTKMIFNNVYLNVCCILGIYLVQNLWAPLQCLPLFPSFHFYHCFLSFHPSCRKAESKLGRAQAKTEFGAPCVFS